MQKYKPQKISNKRKKINEFIIDETQLKVGSKYVWLWVAIESMKKQILQVVISFERTMLIVAVSVLLLHH
jgi:transposase-like protein